MSVEEIKGFSGEYSFLSNFYECDMDFTLPIFADDEDREVYRMSVDLPTLEHIYQAMKVFKDWETPRVSEVSAFLKFFECRTPGEAKKRGREVPIDTEYWDSVKDEIMESLISIKFSKKNKDLRQKLLDTGKAYLEETNTWHDTYWGVCNGKGENRLGHILMEERQKIYDHELFSYFGVR